MKVKLIFNLPEDKDEYTMAFHAHDYWSVLWHFNAYIYSVLKREEKSTTIEELCQTWFTMLEECGVDVYEIP